MKKQSQDQTQLQSLSPKSQNSNLFNKNSSARHQVPSLNFRYAQHSPNSQLNNSALYNGDRDRPSNNLNPLQNQTPSQRSNISMISPKDNSQQLNQQQDKRHDYQIGKPLKTEDSFYNEGEQKNLESIYQRIQNLRKNIQSQQTLEQQFNTYNQQQQIVQNIPKTLINVNQNTTLQDSSQSNQFQSKHPNFGNQSDHMILQGMMFNNESYTQSNQKFHNKFQNQNFTEEGFIESQRSNNNQFVQTINSLQSYDAQTIQLNTNQGQNYNHYNGINEQQNLLNSEFFSPNPINTQQRFQRYDNNYQEPKQNLSPKLLSTQGDLQLQQSEIELVQSNRYRNAQQQNRSQSINSHQQQSKNNNNLYTFNQSSVNTLNDNQYNPQLISIQDMIRESEDRVKRETEIKFQKKIKDLEKKSLYLDRSLELIEDMKGKFKQIENQSASYNDLLIKYNSLVQQVNNQGKSNSNINQSQNVSRSPSKRLNTIQIQSKDFYQPLSNITLQDMKENLNTNQSYQELRFNQLSLQNQSLKDQNEQLQIEIERLKLQNSVKKLHGKRKTSSPKSSSLRNNRQKSSGILTGGLTLQTVQSTQHLYNRRQAGSNQNSRSRERIQHLYKSQENLHTTVTSQRKRPCQNRTLLTQKENMNSNIELLNFSRDTFVDLHKKIDKLEKEKRLLQRKLKDYKAVNIINENGEIDSQIPMRCCCEELKQIYEDRNQSLEQIADHWKQKTQQLVGKYYKSLQLVREDQLKLRQITLNAVEQLRQFQEKSLCDVLQRQNEIQVYYEKKVKKLESENKKLSKRVVKARNASQK